MTTFVYWWIRFRWALQRAKEDDPLDSIYVCRRNEYGRGGIKNLEDAVDIVCRIHYQDICRKSNDN